MSPAHLAQDLILAEDLGVEPRRDQEQVAHRRQPVAAVRRSTIEQESLAPGERLEPGLLTVVAPPVQLEPIAGSKHNQGPFGAALAIEPIGDLRRGGCQLLVNTYVGCVVTYADEVKRQ